MFYKGSLLFTVNETNVPYALWYSDGTPAGTIRLASIQAFLTDFYYPYSLSDRSSSEFGGYLYFPANNGSTGMNLWRTDGTPEGTQLVKDLSGEWPYYSIDSMGSDGYFLYFLVFRGSNNGQQFVEIWRSDGNQDGTQMLLNRSSGRIAVVNQRAIFSLSDSVNTQLLRSTETGDLEQFATIPSGNQMNSFVYYGGQVYFTAGARFYPNAAVYRTDGQTVQEIRPAGSSAALNTIQGLAVVGSNLFISGKNDATQGLWKLAESASEAELVQSFANPPTDLIAAGNRVFFLVSDGLGMGKSYLWVSDGTSSGTHQVCPDCVPPTSLWNSAVAWQDQLYFANGDSAHGIELWETDGSDQGTRLFLDLRPGPESSKPRYLVALGDKIFFAADDWIHGSEPWALIRVFDQKVYLPNISR
jgi:ELWxxDGT repeat protein